MKALLAFILLPVFACAVRADIAVQSLDGDWKLAIDPDEKGEAGKWSDPATFPESDARIAHVPYPLLAVWPDTRPFSAHPRRVAWYLLTFTPKLQSPPHVRQYLRFGSVEDSSDVWLNGTHLGSHAGGEDPFEYDVTSVLRAGQPNTIIVRDVTSLFGGIMEHVALVTQPEVRIIDAFAQPDTAKGQFKLDVTVENNTPQPAQVDLAATCSKWDVDPDNLQRVDKSAATVTAAPGRSTTSILLPLAHPHLWNLDDPFLYFIRVTSDWKGGVSDSYQFRTGLRDFRLVDGWFCLNGHRIFLKAAHSNRYDPINIMGSPGNPKYIAMDARVLKEGGFNMMRMILSDALPEQLDWADEQGLLIWSEHETSWLNPDPAKFGRTLNQIVRRDRNHPSLVLWGMLNETPEHPVFEKARDWLPQVRDLDPTRPVIMNSGRFDSDFKTASLSNTGSRTWDVYLGGEDPQNPKPTGHLSGELGAYRDGTGDMHVYPLYPMSWAFITDFENLDMANPHPFFLSESGLASSFNPFAEQRELKAEHAPDDAYPWNWTNPTLAMVSDAWSKYDLAGTYPKPEQMFIDSYLEAAKQRELLFTLIRGHPKITSYNLTSLFDAGGGAEGFLDNFRNYKAGHLEVMKAGWAPLRWCLLAHPTNAYADQPIRVQAALANEDLLPPGDYPATLHITGPSGEVWKQAVTAHFDKGGAMACRVFDADVKLANLHAGTYTLSASLDGRANAAAPSVPFTLADRAALPKLSGTLTVLGLDGQIRDFLTKQGAQLHDYVASEKTDHDVIIVGRDFHGKAADWRALYLRIARGAHAIFLAGNVFDADHAPDKWLAVAAKGSRNNDRDWLYHKDVIAKAGHPFFAGLPTKLISPEIYDQLLADTHFFQDVTPPPDTSAVAITATDDENGHFHTLSGVMLGTYPFHDGHFTLNAFNFGASLGNPAVDRLLINLVLAAQKDSSAIMGLNPPDIDTELDQLGIKD